MATRPGDAIADEQTALRRVAMLVAQGVPPEDVFAAVTEEAGRVIAVDYIMMARYDPDAAATAVGAWARTDAGWPSVGTRWGIGGRNVTTRIFETGRPARIDDYAGASGPAADLVRGFSVYSCVGAPITLEGRLWGLMAVMSKDARLPADTEARLAGFTELVATAIANAQARVELRGYAEEQAALRRVATLVARGASPDDVFAACAAEAGRVLPADYTFLSRYDADGAQTWMGAWSGTGTAVPFPVGSRGNLGGRNLSTLVFETGRPVRIDDYSHSTGPIAEMARQVGISSAVGVPIRVEGRLWGVMIGCTTGAEPMTADTEARLAGFTEVVATAIANAQARVELRGHAEEQAALRRVATLVARGIPPEQVFAAVTEEAGRVLGYEFTFMGRYDADGVATAVGAWARRDPAAWPSIGTRWGIGGQNVTTMVYETGRPARISDYADASGPAADLVRGFGVRSCVGVPVTLGGRLWGLMTVMSKDAQPPADTEARLAGFTEMVATAIANAQARLELRVHAEEQAALRRVATLVARGVPSEEVFAAVAAEVGRLLDTDFAFILRYEPDDMATIVGSWTRTGAVQARLVGTRIELGEGQLSTLVYRTHRPARIDAYGETTGTAADIVRELQLRSNVGAPISVGGRLWGVMSVASTRQEPLPPDSESRLAGFTELVGTALANAEAQTALTASRARIVATADATRRQIERDLHDGAQQRLVSLALELRTAQAAVPPGASELRRRLDGLAAGLTAALDELREIAGGIHPAVLVRGGLRPALRGLARRCAVPVDLRVGVEDRLPEPIEIAAYYVVSEALTNTAKHAHASAVGVEVEVDEGVLQVHVHDDGCGGADFGHGSGLVGIKDRIEALGGRIVLQSPPGTGTTLEVHVPLSQARAPLAGGAGHDAR